MEIRKYLIRFYRSNYFNPIVIAILFLCIKTCHDTGVEDKINLIKSDMAFGKAQLIKQVPRGYRRGSHFDWQVYINEESLIISQRYYSCEDEVLYRWVPVVYSNKNPNIFEVLDSPPVFSDFGVPFPDSLNWMLDCRSD